MDPVTDSMEVNLEDEIITLPREKALKYSEYFRACHEHEGKFGHPGALSKVSEVYSSFFLSVFYHVRIFLHRRW